MILQIYQVLSARLKAAVPELKNVDWYNGQDETDDEITVVPVAYLKFAPVMFESLPENKQMVKFKFSVRLVTKSLSEKQGIVKHLQIEENIYIALQNYNAMLSDLPEGIPEGMDNRQLINSINRIAIKPDHRQSSLVRTEQEFEAIAFDFAAVKRLTTKEIKIRLDTGLKTDLQ